MLRKRTGFLQRYLKQPTRLQRMHYDARRAMAITNPSSSDGPPRNAFNSGNHDQRGLGNAGPSRRDPSCAVSWMQLPVGASTFYSITLPIIHNPVSTMSAPSSMRTHDPSSGRSGTPWQCHTAASASRVFDKSVNTIPSESAHVLAGHVRL